MSVHDASPDRAARDHPADLEWAVDDEAHPTELTVYSDRDGERTTHWMTVDLDHAVDLAGMA